MRCTPRRLETEMQVNAHRDSPKRRATTTKSGPGRRHVSGSKKATPVPQKGAPLGFELHKASAEKRERRAAIKSIGRRQYLKVTKAARPLRDIGF